MTAPTNTTTSLNNPGGREDIEDVIYRVAPEETPFISNVGSVKATATYHVWQTEQLANVDVNNAQLEGDDVSSLDAPNNPLKVGNHCQIFRKTGGVSRSQEIVKKAGRDSEMDRQKVLKGRELKRDVEARFIGNYASVAESGGVARKSGGALAWIASNTSVGATGANGGFNQGTKVVDAAANGTARTLTETLVKAVLSTTFGAGGSPKQAYMGANHKQQFSAFTGIAQIRADAPRQAMATIIGAADVYVSDFGNLTLIPHPYGLTRDLLLIDPEHFKVGTLDGTKSTALAKTGDSERFMVTAEKCLVCTNEKAHAAIRDLT